jgi:hypothetical protein
MSTSCSSSEVIPPTIYVPIFQNRERFRKMSRTYSIVRVAISSETSVIVSSPYLTIGVAQELVGRTHASAETEEKRRARSNDSFCKSDELS